MTRLVFGMNQSLDGYVDHTAFAPSPTLFRHFIEETQGQAGSVYGSASRTSARPSGSSPSCSTIWAILTTRWACWSRSRIPSARKCYPSARNELTPIRPEWTLGNWLLRLDSNQQPSG